MLYFDWEQWKWIAIGSGDKSTTLANLIFKGKTTFFAPSLDCQSGSKSQIAFDWRVYDQPFLGAMNCIQLFLDIWILFLNLPYTCLNELQARRNMWMDD